MSYSINPYTGCTHACIYCYATFMKKYSKHDEAWGEFVDAKSNIGEVLAREVRKKKTGEVCVGTVSDPYQPIEKESQLMRSVIPILKQAEFPFHILTKSSLVLRDIDLLTNYPQASVSVTLTTIDENIRKIFEPGADTIANRLNAVRELTSAKIATRVFFGPVLPYFSDSAKAIDEIFKAVKSTGVKRVLVDRLNYVKNKIDLILQKTGRGFPEAVNYYNHLLKRGNQYNIWMKQNVYAMAQKHNLIVEVVF